MARLRFLGGGSGGRQRKATGGRPSTVDAIAYPDPRTFHELGGQRAGDALCYLVPAHSTQACRNEQFVGKAITFARLAAMLRCYAADGRKLSEQTHATLIKVARRLGGR